MGCCCLPPERVKLTVNSKKETNGRVKVGQESKWAKDQHGLLLFTPLKSRTNSEQQERSKWQSQSGPRVIMDQGSTWAAIVYPLKESN